MTLPPWNKYPKKIYFADECYRISFVKKLDCYGVTHFDKKLIQIKKGMSTRQIFSTFIHELLHVVEYEDSVQISHKVVYQLEKALCELMIDNFL